MRVRALRAISRHDLLRRLRPVLAELRPAFSGRQLQGPSVLTWFSDICNPNSVQHLLGASLGTDTEGRPIVLSFAQMQWSYNFIRPDEWYYLENLEQLARRTTSTTLAGHLRIRWPNPETGTQQDVSARWQPLPPQDRQFAGFAGITLTFSHLGFDDTTVTGTWRPIPPP